jgi:drug/metabolite transporter (DMT)-like permease
MQVSANTPPRLDLRVVAAMLALGIAGTALAYIWNTAVLSAWGAVSAATVTYLIPLVGGRPWGGRAG